MTYEHNFFKDLYLHWLFMLKYHNAETTYDKVRLQPNKEIRKQYNEH